MNKKNAPLTDLFPHSLQLEAQQVLGEEFSRLPKRIQTGYTTTFWNHGNIIKHNKHNRKPDSFPMGEKEVSRNFTDPRNFKAVNSKGYYLIAIPEIARADFDNTIAYAEAGEKDKEEWDWYRYGMSKRPKLQHTVCEPNRGGYEAYMLGIKNQP